MLKLFIKFFFYNLETKLSKTKIFFADGGEEGHVGIDHEAIRSKALEVYNSSLEFLRNYNSKVNPSR